MPVNTTDTPTNETMLNCTNIPNVPGTPSLRTVWKLRIKLRWVAFRIVNAGKFTLRLNVYKSLYVYKSLVSIL